MNITQAEVFFSKWSELHSPQESEDKLCKWKNFFTTWAKISSTKTNFQKFKAWTNTDCEAFTSFAYKFNEPYQRYRKSGVMANIWKIAGLERNELQNSQILAWMLNRHGNHGQEAEILKKLMEEISKQSIAKEAANNILRILNSGITYQTNIESLPLGDIESRVDIEIESSDFLIFIEVKIGAAETNNQLERYVNLSKIKGTGKTTLVIFLTPNGSLPKNNKLHGCIIPFSWRQIANILDKNTTSTEHISFISHIFCQFANHIRQQLT